jgi:hypothetical protein
MGRERGFGGHFGGHFGGCVNICQLRSADVVEFEFCFALANMINAVGRGGGCTKRVWSVYQRGYLQLALFDAVCVTTRTVLKSVYV